MISLSSVNINSLKDTPLTQSHFIGSKQAFRGNFSSSKPLNYDQDIYAKQNSFINYRVNNNKDIFLRNVLISSLREDGVQIPKGVLISVSAPRTITDETKESFRNIIFGQFKGFTNYFFELFSKPENNFKQTVENLKIPTILKEELNSLYNYLDNYYQLKIKLPGDIKNYNILSLSEKDKRELIDKATPENRAFIEKILQESGEIKQLATKFSRSEMERAVLFEAGENSRNFITKLIAGIFLLAGLEHYKPAMVSALGPQTSIGKYFNNITEFVGGCGDDCLGSYKDYFQDEVTFGKPIAQKILGLSIFAGIASSAVAAPLGTGTAIGAILYGNASSGSSIFSNLATFFLMFKNYDNMVEKGIIEPPENCNKGIKKFIHKLNTTWKNFAAYDAYFGKVIGILACTPAAYIAFKTGAIQSQSKWVKAGALMLVGSIESYITVIIQLLRDNLRKAKIKTSKELISSGKFDVNEYDSRKYEIKGSSKLSQKLKSSINFFKTFNEDP
ncbi:MAG: hypothetical protein AB1782_20180 [Cyanobacteriota bacterium]